MITMMDEIFDRNYQAGRADLNDGLDRAFARIGKELGNSFKALHHVQWDAPWARQGKDPGHA
jgi:hypothetical protein